MAKWVSANMAAFLPDGTTDIFASINDLTSVITPPLELVQSALEAAKIFLIGLDPFDWLGALAATIEDFKNAFLASGIYVCQMWDYPVRQIHQEVPGRAVGEVAYGPDNTIGTFNISAGHIFEESFLQDLNDSFDDRLDPNAPRFRSNVSMLVLVTGTPGINDIRISTEEDSLIDAFQGLAGVIGGAARNIRALRLKNMLARIKSTAQAQEPSKVSVRVNRIERSIHLVGLLSDQEIDAIEYPEDDTGAYFEGRDLNTLDWISEVIPILEAVESQFLSSKYPDWNKLSLVNLHPDIQNIIDAVFDPVIDLLQSGSSITNATVAMINAISDKITELEELIERISDIQEEIDRLLNVTGLHALYISTSQGIPDLQDKLLNATDVPFTGNNFYAGMALLAGEDAKVTFDALLATVGEAP